MPLNYKLKTSTLIALILLLDQITKYLAIKFLYPEKTISLLPFLNLVYVENTGTAFGLMKFLGSGIFILIAMLATLLLVYFLLKDGKNWYVYSLLIGGALGNVTDRILRGYVIDFVDLHIGGFHWPAFNLADSAISIGIVLFIYKNLKK